MGFFDYLEELKLTTNILKNFNFWIVYFIVFIIISIINYKMSKKYGSRQSNFFSFILLLVGIILSGLSVIVPDYYNNKDSERFVYSKYKTYSGENFTNLSEKNITTDEKNESDELPISEVESDPKYSHEISDDISKVVDNVCQRTVKNIDNNTKIKVKYILSSYDPYNDPYSSVKCKQNNICKWCSKEFESTYRGTSVKMSLWRTFDMSETVEDFNFDYSEEVKKYVYLIDKGILSECNGEIISQRYCSKKCESENRYNEKMNNITY